MKGITIILSSLLVIASGSVFDDVKQYEECKHLAMVENNPSEWWSYWTPDTTVENNSLDDAFYQSQGYDGVDFDENIEIMKNIKNELEGCDTDFCRCAKKGPNQWGANYSVYFQENTYDDVKTIIKELDEKLGDNVVPDDQLKNSWGYGSNANLPTLTNFSIPTEYGMIRGYRYTNFWNCFTWNYTEYLTCYYESKVDYENREVLFYGDKRSAKKQLICSLFSLKSCPVEQFRFYAMSLWADPYYNFDICDQSLLDVMDELIYDVNNYDLKDAVDSTYVSFWQDSAYYKAYKTSWGQTTTDNIGSSFNCVYSNEFSVFCETKVDQNNNTIISGLTVTAADGTVFAIDECKLNDIQNGTIKNGQGENVFEIVVWSYAGSDYKYIEIYDFESKSVIGFNKNYISLTSPISLLEKSTGFLVDGPETTGTLKSIASNKMACKSVCENMSKTISQFGPYKHSNSRQAFARCSQDC